MKLLKMGQRRKSAKNGPHYKTGRGSTRPKLEKTAEKLPDVLASSKSRDDADQEPLLPTWTPWLVTIVTLVIRVCYVIDPSSWWVLHPDEIFQSMEVAHTELYGYGLRPYEYIPPAKGDNLSHYMLREKTLGMNAMRSPLMPQFFMLVSLVMSWTGAQANPYLLWRVGHLLVSSTLPLAVAVYVNTVCKSRDHATMASILTAASAHLTAFGTHSLINSFISPILFLVLSYSVHLLTSETNEFFRQVKTLRERQEQPGSSKFDYFSFHIQKIVSKIYANPDFVTSRKPNNKCDFADWTIITSSSSDHKHDSVTANEEDHKGRFQTETPHIKDHGGIFQFSETMTKRRESRSSRSSDPGYHSSGGSSNGDMTPSNVSDEEPVGDGKENHQLMREDSVLEESQDKSDDAVGNSTPKEPQKVVSFTSGIILATVIYIRPDSVLLVASLLLGNIRLNMAMSLLSRKAILYHVFGGFIGLLIALGDDIYFYGSFTVTPFNWVKFNVFSNMSSELYGSSGVLFYIQEIFFFNLSMSVLSFIFIILMAIIVINCIFHQYCNLIADVFFNKYFNGLFDYQMFSTLYNKRVTKIHIFTVVAMTVIYSCMGHKEIRFLHDIIVLFIISISGMFHITAKSMKISRNKIRILIISILLAVSANQLSAFQSTNGTLSDEGQKESSSISAETNQCLHYISSQDDVTGVFLERNIQDTASFSLLHKQVPVIFVLGNECYEFDNSSLISFQRTCLSGHTCSVSYFSLHTVSELIHVRNSKALIKRIIEYKHYNYALVNADKDFFYPAYTKVFDTKTTAVWKRTYDSASEASLINMAAGISQGGDDDGAILEYEAEILKQLGNYHLALNRFQLVLGKGYVKPSVYASMAFCLHRMGDDQRMKNILKKCLQRYTRQECYDGDKARVLTIGNGFTSITK